MASLPLVDVLSRLLEYPDLAGELVLSNVVHFIDLACLTAPLLRLSQSIHTPGHLETLPVYIHDFLKACLDIPDDSLKLLWEVFGEMIWKAPHTQDLVDKLAPQYLEDFLSFGPSRGVGKCLYSTSV
jgi:hypothetical protein